MAEAEDRGGLAAEYALGTLDGAERRDAERLLATDPDFAGLVEEWERRLSPLALALEPIEAPPHIRGNVMRAIAGDGKTSATVIELRRRAARWRGLALGASALAAALALFIVFRPAPLPDGGRYVALLQAEGPEPAFVASIDLAAGTIRVRTLGAQPQPGKSYELWALGAGREKPESLGLIDASLRIPAAKLGRIDPKTLGETVFAVSLEAAGGSATGQPLGPVLYTGKLVAAE